MMSSAPNAEYQRNAIVERDMGTHQRGLIDTCIEEGQYDSAIALLDQLRSSTYRPSLSQVRQIIYIALQPLDCSNHDKSLEMSHTDALPSPVKLANKYTPSETAILASHRLLLSLIKTNSPSSLARALPRYENTPSDDDPGDSEIGKEALRISMAKNCWMLLKEGFVQFRPKPSSYDKGKKRSHTCFQETLNGDPLCEGRTVGENAWPFLDWLVMLFERDESLAVHEDKSHFSPLLLEQIPAPRSGSGARWDVELPLNIVFCCLKENDIRRRRIGIRLMTLLINVSSTPHLDSHMFVASVFSRLSASGSDRASIFFSELTPTPVAHRFKISLCMNFLAYIPGSAQTLSHGRHKAQPKALRSVDKSIPTSTLPSRYPLPNCNDICLLLKANTVATVTTAITRAFLLRVKLELLVSYGTSQFEAPVSQKDPEWARLVREGKLRRILDSAFSSDDKDSIYVEAMQSIINTWCM